MSTRHVLRCGLVTILAQAGAVALSLLVAADTVQAQAAATPRTADGKPDFSGIWGGGGGGGGGDDEDPVDAKGNFTVLNVGRPCHPGQECGPAVNAERDAGVNMRYFLNRPKYKPEFWERVQYADYNGNYDDLSGRCYPLGLPRQGMPLEIIQTPTKMIFLYNNRYRIFPIDGRPHDPIRSQDLLWYGDSVGKWEGDTLVVESVGFTNESWLGTPGWLHGFDMRVVERYRREGNTLHRETTVYDPEYLEEPWVMNPIQATLGPNQGLILPETPPCDEKHWENMQGFTRERG